MSQLNVAAEIARQLQQAQGNAAALPAEVPGAMHSALAIPTGGAPITLDRLMAGSMSVTSWLKVNEYGLFVGTDKTPFDELKLAVKLDEVQYCWSIKWEAGSPQYDKTYDEVTAVKGGSWPEVVRKAQQIDPRARPYRSADVPFYVLEDIKNKKGEVLVEAGQQIGHSLSTTGWKAWSNLVRDLRAKGIDPVRDQISLSVSSTVTKNDKGTWGILTFKDVDLMPSFPWED